MERSKYKFEIVLADESESKDGIHEREIEPKIFEEKVPELHIERPEISKNVCF